MKRYEIAFVQAGKNHSIWMRNCWVPAERHESPQLNAFSIQLCRRGLRRYFEGVPHPQEGGVLWALISKRRPSHEEYYPIKQFFFGGYWAIYDPKDERNRVSPWGATIDRWFSQLARREKCDTFYVSLQHETV